MRNHLARLLIGTLCVAAVIAPMPSANAASKFDGSGALCFGQNPDRVSPLTEAQYKWPTGSFRLPAPPVPSLVAFRAMAR